MIALGGAIGTGLFYGSAASIQLVGPGIIVSYIVGGFVMYLIMRMLGEMSTEEPVAGAFSHFAYKYWGEFAGFLAGWNYWFLYILVSMAELTVVGIYVAYWFPDFPAWATSLIVLVTITVLNLINVPHVRRDGVLVRPHQGAGGDRHDRPRAGADRLRPRRRSHRHLQPVEPWRVLPQRHLGACCCRWSSSCSRSGGTELIGITAGEADDPKKSIPQAIKQVMWRILIFYIGALTVMMIIFPWNQVGMEGSPFVTIFSKLGIGSAANILNFVVLTAAISVYNSGIYSNGRMLYSLAEQGNAPKLFTKLGANKVPYVAVLFSSACTLVVVVINYLIPEGAFMQVMAVATTAATITWVMIVLVHMKFRKAHAADARQAHLPGAVLPDRQLLLHRLHGRDHPDDDADGLHARRRLRAAHLAGGALHRLHRAQARPGQGGHRLSSASIDKTSAPGTAGGFSVTRPARRTPRHAGCDRR